MLGSPVAHSLSPALHAAAYRELGLSNWVYDRVEVTKESLRAFLDGLGAEWVGLSLTMPLKQAVLPLLDHVSTLAAAVGAVNTVTFGPADGGRPRRRGDNTDVAGVVGALREAGVSRLPAGGGAGVVVGGGATAASALAALAEMGCREPVVVVRSAARSGIVLAAAERLGVSARLVLWRTGDRADQAALFDVLADAEVVVAAVPAGAADGLADVVQERAAVGARCDGVLLDVVYDPWPTALAGAWQAAGGTVVDGLAMLVHQAVGQVALWTGRTPSVAALRAAAVNRRAQEYGASPTQGTA